MNKRADIAAGIVIAIIGVGLIIVSPSLVYLDRSVVGGRLDTELRDLAKFGGVALLIVGGIISAVGFGKKDVGKTDNGDQKAYFYRAGQKHGPYPTHSIVEWYMSGKLSDKDLVWIQGSNEWVPMTKFLGEQSDSSNAATFANQK